MEDLRSAFVTYRANVSQLRHAFAHYFSTFQEDDYAPELMSMAEEVLKEPLSDENAALQEIVLLGLMLKQNDEVLWEKLIAARLRRQPEGKVDAFGDNGIKALRHMQRLFVPEFAGSQGEVDGFRKDFEKSLMWLLENFDSWVASPIIRPVQLLPIMSRSPAYALTYHEASNKKVMKLQARLYAKLLKHELKVESLDLVAGRPFPSGSKIPVRVAFVSRSLGNHSVGKIAVGLLEELHARHRDSLQVYVYGAAATQGQKLAQDVRGACTKYTAFAADETLIGWAEGIRRDQPDVVVFLDPIMDINMYLLACFRLAPVQMATWGHPDTTGLPFIDYYVTSELFEESLDRAEMNYSETPILMKSMGFVYKLVDELFGYPLVGYFAGLHRHTFRGLFGIPREANVYGVTGYAFKIYPGMDAIFSRVLSEDPAGVLVLMQGKKRALFDQVLARVQGAVGPEAAKRILVVPHQDDMQNYLKLVHAFDVVLETRPFGGCISSFESFFCGRCVVTWPSLKLCGRFTQGLYRRMQIADPPIATGPDDYVSLAVRLATNQSGARDAVEQAIAKNLGRILNTKDAADEWKELLLRLARRK
jgi:protein O-GlcNAc transferase